MCVFELIGECVCVCGLWTVCFSLWLNIKHTNSVCKTCKPNYLFFVCGRSQESYSCRVFAATHSYSRVKLVSRYHFIRDIFLDLASVDRIGFRCCFFRSSRFASLFRQAYRKPKFRSSTTTSLFFWGLCACVCVTPQKECIFLIRQKHHTHKQTNSK